MQPLMSAALIVKNEETFLPGCLASLNAIRPLLGEICVYDTGSTDSTVALAEAAGAVVKAGYWDNDFARARNEAIAMCSNKWVLIIDADERIHVNASRLHAKLLLALSDSLVGYDLVQVVVEDISRTGQIVARWLSPRILRAGRMTYEGRIHEMPRPTREGGKVRQLDPGPQLVRLSHHGYSSAEVLTDKGRRNLDLAELDTVGIEADAGGRLAHKLMNRARSRRLAGDHEGYLDDLRRIRRLGENTGSRRLAGELLMSSLIATRQSGAAEMMLSQLRVEGADLQYCSWLEAQLRLAAGEYAAALALLRTIDVPVNAAGVILSPQSLVEARMIAAARCGEIDEATACCVRLMASFGKVDGYGSLLATLWGRRDPKLMAELILGTSREYTASLIREMESVRDPGPAIAAALRRGSSRGGRDGVLSAQVS